LEVPAQLVFIRRQFHENPPPVISSRYFGNESASLDPAVAQAMRLSVGEPPVFVSKFAVISISEALLRRIFCHRSAKHQIKNNWKMLPVQ
ncbi:MAG: hypothetical protein Q3X20_05455, partial [Adlercreutzia sp.]|nr:hypothetical protein [Adlercreutzia sp.]